MKLDVPEQLDPERVRNEILQGLGVPAAPRIDARAYFSISHALNETTRGLARMFPHKKSVAFVRGTGPYFEPLMTLFSMEGYQIQGLPPTGWDSKESLEALKSDTLFVLWSEDDPFHGGLLAPDPSALSVLEGRKIFSISLSHRAHGHRPNLKPGPFTLSLLSASQGAAFAVLGDRSHRIESLLFGPRGWEQDALKQLKNLVFKAFPKEIQEFEEQAQLQALFPLKGRPRLFDRAVLVWEDLDASALAEVLQLSGGAESGSLCRWGGVRSLEWLKYQGWSPEQIRGALVLDGAILDRALGERVLEARTKILQLQKG